MTLATLLWIGGALFLVFSLLTYLKKDWFQKKSD